MPNRARSRFDSLIELAQFSAIGQWHEAKQVDRMPKITG